MNFDSPLTRPKPKASRRGWLQDGKQHERHEGTHRVRVVEADVAVAGEHQRNVDAGWTYDEAYEAVAGITGHVAFYPDRATVTVEALTPRIGRFA